MLGSTQLLLITADRVSHPGAYIYDLRNPSKSKCYLQGNFIACDTMFYDQYCLLIDMAGRQSCKVLTNQLQSVDTNFQKSHNNLDGICGSPTEKSIGLIFN